MQNHGVLEKPYNRLALIRELAVGDQKQTDLAKKYGVTPQAVSAFADRHRLRIEAVRRDVENEFAGIAYANLSNRVEMLNGLVEYATGLLEDPERQARLSVGTAEILGQVRATAHEIAEQLGQLPARGVRHEGGQTVRYVIEGVDPDAYA